MIQIYNELRAINKFSGDRLDDHVGPAAVARVRLLPDGLFQQALGDGRRFVQVLVPLEAPLRPVDALRHQPRASHVAVPERAVRVGALEANVEVDAGDVRRHGRYVFCAGASDKIVGNSLTR